MELLNVGETVLAVPNEEDVYGKKVAPVIVVVVEPLPDEVLEPFR